MIPNATSSTKKVALGTRKLLASGTIPAVTCTISPVLCSDVVGVESFDVTCRSLPRTKTNSAMKARLMKNIASTRPTVRKKIVCRRPWASG